MKKDEFAVIETGGKQYRVSVGDVISIEKLQGKHHIGDKLSFDEPLLLVEGENVSVGKPKVSGAKVTAEIIEIGRARKVMVVKYKQKSRYLRRNGHRQPYFKVKILSVK